jgi:hypothetical protein
MEKCAHSGCDREVKSGLYCSTHQMKGSLTPKVNRVPPGGVGGPSGSVAIPGGGGGQGGGGGSSGGAAGASG